MTHVDRVLEYLTAPVVPYGVGDRVVLPSGRSIELLSHRHYGAGSFDCAYLNARGEMADDHVTLRADWLAVHGRLL